MVELDRLSLAFVVNGVEAHNGLEERVQGEVSVWVDRDLEERREYVVDHVREHVHLETTTTKASR